MGVRSWFTARFRGDVSRALQSVTQLGGYYDYPNSEKILPYFDQFACYAFGGNAVVFAVESRRMDVFSEATFKYRRLRDKVLFGDQSLAKLEQPWPGGSTGDLLTRMLLHADLGGAAYVRDLGDRVECLRPDWVTIVSEIKTDADGREYREIIGVVFEPTGDPDRATEFIPIDEVAIWTPVPDPTANFRGMSWLTPVIREINTDQRMSDFRDAYFSNAATPNIIIKYQQKVAPEKIKALGEMIQARTAGPENAFRTLTLDEGADPMIVGSNMDGSAFDALQSASETRIAAAGGVPPVVAGLRMGLQYSEQGEYQTGVRAFVDLEMRPLWRSACAALAKLVAVPGGAELWHDVTDVSALQPGEQDAAGVASLNAATLNQLIMAGFTPESAVNAVTSGDMSLLVHSGLVSVQMQNLQAAPEPPIQADVVEQPALPAGRSMADWLESWRVDAEIADPVIRAMDHNQLHAYWTHGEGLAKWAKSPHPWTSLYHHLLKYLPAEEAKRTATNWFFDVFHFYPGSDKNRVLHGKPPRGHKLGPG